jgi:hypothetical protein
MNTIDCSKGTIGRDRKERRKKREDGGFLAFWRSGKRRERLIDSEKLKISLW